MTHKLSSITGKTAVCSQCGEVKVYRASKLSKPVCWEWQKEKNKADRAKKARTRVTPDAIRKVESERNLKAPELKKLLRETLSKVCRIRDKYTCFMTGRVCPPGITPGTGQAAHLIPINDLPPEYRYDPRVVVWMEGATHSNFDGRTRFGQKTANQAAVWGKLARVNPELFIWLTGLPKANGQDRVKTQDLRDQLAKLRKVLADYGELE